MYFTLLSFSLRVFCQLSVIALPYFLFEKVVYGQYIYMYSVCQLLAYVLDYGFSVYVLRLDPQRAYFNRVVSRLNVRDFSYLLVGAVFAYLLPGLFLYILGTVVGALWIGRLAKVRITSGAWAEFIPLGVNALGIFIALGGCAYWNVDDAELVLLLAVIFPRIAAVIVVCAWPAFAARRTPRFKTRYQLRSVAKDVFWLSPYAAQGIFTAATMNVDTLVMAGLGVSPVIIADVKLLMVIIGGLCIPIDVIGQYRISGGVEALGEKRQVLLRYERTMERLAILGAIAVSTVLVTYKNFPFFMFGILPICVLARARTVTAANDLTMMGRKGQSSRISRQIAINLTYWVGLAICARTETVTPYLVFILALCVSHYLLIRTARSAGC